MFFFVGMIVPEFAMWDEAIGSRYFWPVYPVIVAGTGSWLAKLLCKKWNTKGVMSVLVMVSFLGIMTEYIRPGVLQVLLYEGDDNMEERIAMENCRAIYVTTGDYTYVYQFVKQLQSVAQRHFFKQKTAAIDGE